jgi:VCBS repeat-containing protein
MVEAVLKINQEHGSFSLNSSCSIHQDAVTAGTTLEKLKRFDSRNDVWIILSHDGSLNIATPGSDDTGDAITLFPSTIKDWAKKGWKEHSRFAFLDIVNRANLWVNVTS